MVKFNFVNLINSLKYLNFCSALFFNDREFRMRISTSPHHTNPRSATLDFWRKTTPYDQYKVIQHKRRTQMNVPTR